MTEGWPTPDPLTRRRGLVHTAVAREADMAGQEHMSLVGRTNRGGIRSWLWLPLFDDRPWPPPATAPPDRCRCARIRAPCRLRSSPRSLTGAVQVDTHVLLLVLHRGL